MTAGFWISLVLASLVLGLAAGVSIYEALRERRHLREMEESWRMIDQMTEERRQRLAHLQHASKGFDAQRKPERMLGIVHKKERLN